MTGWHDISTAPKDGTPVLLAHRLAEDETEFEVGQGVFIHGSWWVANTDTEPPGYILAWPDFWMPLPEPPEGA